MTMPTEGFHPPVVTTPPEVVSLDGERAPTEVFPHPPVPFGDPYPSMVSSLAPKKFTPLTIALLALTAVLLVAVAGLTAGLVGANGRASTAAVALAAAKSSAAAAASSAQESLTAAQAAQQSAEERASTAEAAASSAQKEAQAAQALAPSPSSPAADDSYLTLLRTGDPAFASVPDATLINIGKITCQYFDQNGPGTASVIHLMDNAVSHGLTSHEGAAVIAAATDTYCSQYKIGR